MAHRPRQTQERDVLYDIPGRPRMLQRRADLMAKFRGYANYIERPSSDKFVEAREEQPEDRRAVRRTVSHS